MQDRPAFTVEGLSASLGQLGRRVTSRQLCVAVSGGVDSHVLLHALARLRGERRSFELRAIHVNHHLHDQADQAQSAVEIFARAMSVPLTVFHVDVPLGGAESVEAAAREARYRVIRESMRKNELLLTAHHRDDQFETVLLQLLRGAGVAGLAAMPRLARFGPGWHARPLLQFDREALSAYARANGVVWADDPTNLDTRFDRNYLRHTILPLVLARWPAASTNVTRSASHLAEAGELLDELAAADVRAAADGLALRIPVLRSLSPERQRNALRHWIRAGGRKPPPTTRLREILAQVLDARPEAVPVIEWEQHEARRYRDRLYVSDSIPGTPESIAWDWRRQPELDLGPGLGRLRIAPADASGLPVGKLPRPLRVKWREGSASLRPDARRPSRTLKHLFQEAGIVPWMRQRIPLLFAGNSLVAVGDLWADARLQPSPAAPAAAKAKSARGKKGAVRRTSRTSAERHVIQWLERPELF
jgi:tRNA(Ile)-lysidine synthase